MFKDAPKGRSPEGWTSVLCFSRWTWIPVVIMLVGAALTLEGLLWKNNRDQGRFHYRSCLFGHTRSTYCRLESARYLPGDGLDSELYRGESNATKVIRLTGPRRSS